ncbi:hypothetical protein ACTA71_002803 [Dictyostelium dimigraforme]
MATHQLDKDDQTSQIVVKVASQMVKPQPIQEAYMPPVSKMAGMALYSNMVKPQPLEETNNHMQNPIPPAGQIGTGNAPPPPPPVTGLKRAIQFQEQHSVNSNRPGPRFNPNEDRRNGVRLYRSSPPPPVDTTMLLQKAINVDIIFKPLENNEYNNQEKHIGVVLEKIGKIKEDMENIGVYLKEKEKENPGGHSNAECFFESSRYKYIDPRMREFRELSSSISTVVRFLKVKQSDLNLIHILESDTIKRAFSLGEHLGGNLSPTLTNSQDEIEKTLIEVGQYFKAMQKKKKG